MGQSIHLRPLLALRLLGALVGLVALALSVETVRGVALVVTVLRTIPVASLAFIPPSDRPGLALLLALLSRALLVAPAPYLHALDAAHRPREEAPCTR